MIGLRTLPDPGKCRTSHRAHAMGRRKPSRRPSLPPAHLLNRGEPLLAYNAAQAGLARWPGAVRLRQLEALALARSGDIERAHAKLEALAGEGLIDAETLGMLARTHKDLALRATDAALRGKHLEAGFALYRRAFEDARRAGAAADATYTGINAATMAVLLGDLELARRHRDRRPRDLPARRRAAGTARYWREATLGEAALILGDGDAAAAHYAAAARLAGGRYGDVSSTRRQAKLLAAHLPGAGGDVTAILGIPPVLVFTGHMIDERGRATARFPAALEGRVREALRARLAAIRPVAAYGSAACGADILCLELVRELGGETHVVLPFPPAEFRRASVDIVDGDWGERFERALAAADSVTVTSDHHASGSAATFEYANLVLTGMGRLRAQLLDTSVQALAVRDPAAGGAPGGAASLVSLWERNGLPVEQVSLAGLRGGPPEAAAPIPAIRHETGALHGMRHEMRAMLFADAVGYSQLSEDQIPRYVAGFLGAVADLAGRTAHRFEHVEVAGDGLYMVFGGVADAGLFALELGALARRFDRAACGLPPGFDLRIALHCGPVHCGREPDHRRADLHRAAHEPHGAHRAHHAAGAGVCEQRLRRGRRGERRRRGWRCATSGAFRSPRATARWACTTCARPAEVPLLQLSRSLARLRARAAPRPRRPRHRRGRAHRAHRAQRHRQVEPAEDHRGHGARRRRQGVAARRDSSSPACRRSPPSRPGRRSSRRWPRAWARARGCSCDYHEAAHALAAHPGGARRRRSWRACSELQEALEAADGWTLEHRIEATLDRLALPADAPVAELSGRPEEARGARARAGAGAGAAAPRRAHQPPRRRRHRMAGGDARRLPRRGALRDPRPALPRPRGRCASWSSTAGGSRISPATSAPTRRARPRCSRSRRW